LAAGNAWLSGGLRVTERTHGLRGSDPTRSNLNRRLRVTEKKSDQVALPPDAGFGEDAFDLRAHGVFSRAHGIRDLPRCMTVTQQQCVVGEENKDLDERRLKIKNRSYSQAEAGMNC